jgi:hypothetical protein
MLFLTFEDGKLVLMNDDDKVVATVESAADVVNALLTWATSRTCARRRYISRTSTRRI